jgi:hypothetical protein
VSPLTVPDALWLWLAVAGLGLFHGINPAMGWLFAVALGLNRRSERIVWLALLPIGLGHALAVALVLFAVLALGLIIEPPLLRPLAAVILFAWAAWHALYGRRHKVRFGMQVGLGGLFMWSFLMANAHGAGLMLFRNRRTAPSSPAERIRLPQLCRSAVCHAPIDCLIARCKVALLIGGTLSHLVGRHAGPNPGDLFDASLLILGDNDVIAPRTDLGGWSTLKLTHIND